MNAKSGSKGEKSASKGKSIVCERRERASTEATSDPLPAPSSGEILASYPLLARSRGDIQQCEGEICGGGDL